MDDIKPHLWAANMPTLTLNGREIMTDTTVFGRPPEAAAERLAKYWWWREHASYWDRQGFNGAHYGQGWGDLEYKNRQDALVVEAAEELKKIEHAMRIEETVSKPAPETIDITPDREGAIRFARMLLKQSPQEAEVGRKMLETYGLTE